MMSKRPRVVPASSLTQGPAGPSVEGVDRGNAWRPSISTAREGLVGTVDSQGSRIARSRCDDASSTGGSMTRPGTKSFPFLDYLSEDPVFDARSSMLVDENRVPIGVERHEMRGPRRAFVRLRHESHPLRFQTALQLAHVCKRLDRLPVFVPSRVEGQQVLLEHALKEADDRLTVLEDLPSIRRIPHERHEAKLLVEPTRCLEVL